ncbi:unnamed protein product [Clonostachys rosea]|uniref:Transport protein USO1 n=1 Tax=Bionectria ochroleuca TaxID=29856 RepID=A0ABY6U126_BIOOC|nr:unnamed protein product [Clonostachys rosea]
MSHYERDSPRERELQLRHQHSASSSDHNMRALVPIRSELSPAHPAVASDAMSIWYKLTNADKYNRWDSSDPDRAPPPLPLNPQSPATSRVGTSSAIQSAHAALNERAREANALVPAVTKRMGDHSPERALVKGNHSHRRMQSLQPGTVRDMSLMIESNSNSPATSPTKFSEKLHKDQARLSTPTPSPKKSDLEREFDAISIDKDFMSGSPVPGPSLTPIVRPIVRRPQTQSILGENTPPQSSTMLALQNMGSPPPLKEAEPRLSNITNGAVPPVNGSQSLDQISEQMISLTNIATSLQKEMSQLSRRSRDNATDLLSLKEATNNRDEDIRKSLKDLLSGVTETSSRLTSNHFGGLFLDNKPHDNSPGRFQLPRIPSPKSFSDSFERASISTPSLAGGDSTTSIALLEKIIRDMGTKEGQDALISRLTEVSHLVSGMATAAKVDELLDQVRLQSEGAIIHDNRTVTSRGRHLSSGEESNVSADKPRNHGIVSQRLDQILHNGEGRAHSTSAGRELLNEDLIKIIRSVKDSVAQGGGLTAEVKALVRELRGEVLGMGREIGKRLEQVGQKGIEDTEPPSKDEVSRVIDEGLEQMKDQLNHVLREHRRQSAQSAATAKTLVDYNEIYNAMRTALKDNEASRQDIPDLSRDDVIDAVRDAWETYKPEIEVQQIGLERDEVLACLQEGLLEYAPRDERPVGATRDEVFKAVVEGLKHFVPPQMDTPATLSRDEIIEAVRDCLEEFEFPIAPSAVGNDLSREDMVYAVREGLSDFDLPKVGAVVPHSNNNEQLLSRLEDMIGYLKLEFKAVSQEAKDNVAANGRDTEQVLDATKDGLENLRIAIESYVDRMAGHDDHDDLKHEILNSMETFKEDIAVLVSQSMEASSRVTDQDDDLKHELLRSMDTFKEDIAVLVSQSAQSAPRELPGQDEFNQELMRSMDSFKEELSTFMTRSSESSREQLSTELEGLREIVNSSMVPATPQQGNNKEVLEALHTAVNSIRQEILRPRNETAEIIDALNEGLNDIRAGFDRMSNKPADLTANDEILEALKSGLDSVRSDIDSIRESSNDRAVAAVGRPTDIDEQAIVPVDMVKQDDIKNLEVLITQLRIKVESMEPEPASDHREDFSRLEEMLGNMQRQVEELGSREMPVPIPVPVPAPAPASAAAAEASVPRSVDAEAAVAPPSGDIASKEDVEAIETILRNTKARLDDLIDGEQAVRKEHLDAIETLTLETRESMRLMGADMDTITRKEDLSNMETLVTEVRLGFEELREKMIKDEEDRKQDPEKVTKTDIEAVETVVLEMKNIFDGELPKKEDFVDFAKKDDLAEVAKKDDLADIAKKEDLSEVTKKEDLVDLTKKEDLADLAKTEDLAEITKKEDLVEIAKKEDLAEIVKKDDLADISKKEDLMNLEIMLNEAKEKLDTHTDSTNTALEKRQEEINGVSEKVAEVKVFLEEFQEVLKTKLDDEATGVEALGKLLEGMGEKVDKSENVPTDLKEMFDTMKAEFEDSKTIFAGAKLESDEKLQEARDSLGVKIDEKMGELIAKYDEFQAVLDERNKTAEARDIVTEAAVVDTKAVAEELKLLIDTLGASVTESVDKMEEASQTVFGKVEELVTRNDENHTEDKSEHQQTREQLQQAVTVVEGIQSDFKETQPKVMEAIQALLEMVQQHFEHSKVSTTEIQDKFIEAKSDMLLLPPPEKFDDTQIQQKLDSLVELKYDDSGLRHMIEELSKLKYDDTELREKLEELKYDDTGLKEKLEETKYDDSGLREKLEELKYDDSGLREKLEELKYDDTGLKEKLEEIKYDDSDLRVKLEEIKYDDASLREKLEELKYDDTGLREKLEELKYDDAGLREKLEEIKYDDTGLREKLEELQQLKYDDSEVREKLDKLADAKYDDTEVHEKLDTLVLMRYDDTEVREKLDKLVEDKYDDNVVHEKLDKLVDYSNSTEQALVQLQTLDKVHQSVVKTAADISSFLSSQTQRIADDNEEKEKTLQDLITSVARRRAEKDHLDAAIASLRDEEERLRGSIMSLRTEQESLIRQKTRLTGDVSSLETAMRLRKEDLSEMESRAEKLERRILEGVMDHSRVLIMSKATNSGGDSMNRKRVKKTAVVAEDAATPKASPRPVMNMALSGKRNLAPPGQGGVARRIASLGQITNNVASGGVKRSQSVRTPASSKAYRKRSWGGDMGLGDTDKENMSVRETVEEVDENENPAGMDERVDSNGDDVLGDDQSDTGTLRRGTESEAGHGEYDDPTGEWTEGAAAGIGTNAEESEMVA